MFQFIRRHRFWGFVLIMAVIISFVIFLSPTADVPGGVGGAADLGTINGKKVGYDEFRQAYREAQLGFLLRFGQLPQQAQQNFDPEQEAANRLLLKRKIQQFGIRIPDEAVARRIAEYPFLQDENGSFRKSNYETFLNNLSGASRNANFRLDRNDFERFVRTELAIQELIDVVGLPGKLVSPQEAEEIYRRENRQAETELVVWEASDYVGQVEVDPDALATFFEEQSAMYRTPRQIRLSYVEFHSSDYMDEAEERFTEQGQVDLDQQVDARYEQEGAQAFTDDEGNPLPEEEAKEQIREEILRAEAETAAKQAAYDFLNELYEMEHSAENLERLASARGIAAEETEPFSLQQGVPEGMEVTGRDFINRVSQLTEEEPVSMRAAGQDPFYVYALKEVIPSEVPPLEEVRDQVVEDYRLRNAEELAQADAEGFRKTVTAALEKGKTFAEVADEEGKQLLEPPPFSLQTQSFPNEISQRVSARQLKDVAFALQPGEVSEVSSSQRNRFVLHLKDFAEVTEEELEEELPSYIEDMRNERRFAAFNEWFRQEMQRADLRVGQQEDQEGTQPQPN